jgi:arylsulfatase A-like enzyme
LIWIATAWRAGVTRPGRQRWIGLGLGLLVLVVIGGWALTQLQSLPPPNIVIVLVDTLRADHTSVHGYARDTTPHLRRIAQEGLVLRSHLANAPWTKPSVASLITGLHPSAHGSRTGEFSKAEKIQTLREQGRNPSIEILSEKNTTLAELLKAGGYRTAAYVSNVHLTPKFGYAQGYDKYVYTPWRPDKETIQATIDSLRENDEPTFVWCHLMAVHQYDSPPESRTFEPATHTPIDTTAAQYRRVEKYDSLESAVAAYDNSIAYTDSLIGELFDYISNVEPNTILIVTSDHGEEFFEHGGFEHVRTLYNELLHIPFIAWGPGIPNAVTHGLTDSIDVLPTLLNLVDIDSPGDLLGEILFTKSQVTEGKRESFAEKHHRDDVERFALSFEGRKVILNRRVDWPSESLELYDGELGTEVVNIAGRVDPGLLTALRDHLRAWEAKVSTQFEALIGNRELVELNTYDIEQLRALGYVY